MRIREILHPLCFIFLFTTAAFGQGLDVLPAGGESRLAIDFEGNRIDQRSRYGASIWDNLALTGWFASMTAGYMWLDWGELADQGNGLPDEVIDGFSFSYASHYYSFGITWAAYFYDSCTGWGDSTTVQEAGFIFTGLPAGSP